MDKLQFDGPVVLAILDGVGLAPDGAGNAVSRAWTPFLGKATNRYLHVALEASGLAVGLNEGQMGNSEVGHNTIGMGQIVKHGIARFDEAFRTGEVFESKAWKEAVAKTKDGKKSDDGHPATLHFAGIFSDGGVHSHIAHLEQMIEKAYEAGVRRIRIHAVFDGRDVMPTAEPRYTQRFEDFKKRFPDADIEIASGGGRMTTISDRYGNDWNMVKRGWDMMMKGEAKYHFHSAEEAVTTLRAKYQGVQDQYLAAFVIVDQDNQPVGRIEKGDALIYFDFRADRAIEIAMAFTYWDFPYFDRGDYTPNDVYFVGMTEYNSDTHVPEHRLVEPVQADETLHQFLGEQGVSQLALSETVKFGHVTYYFNGNSYERAEGEDFWEIESDAEPFETRPWMKSAEIADVTIENLEKYKFIRLNFPGGDMVGHTAEMEATVMAMEAIDLSLARIFEKVKQLGGIMIVVADHGNAEELTDQNGEMKTSHTTNKVPCIFCDETANRGRYRLANIEEPGLANLAATVAVLLGKNNYPEKWEMPLIKII